MLDTESQLNVQFSIIVFNFGRRGNFLLLMLQHCNYVLSKSIEQYGNAAWKRCVGKHGDMIDVN